MKAIKFVLALSAFLAFLLVSCSDESQSPVSPMTQSSLKKVNPPIDFTAEDYQIPPYYLAAGVMKTQGQKIILHGAVSYERFESSSSLLNGEMENTVNFVLDKNSREGEVYGQLTLHPYAVPDGVWNANWHGKNVKTGESEWTHTLTVLGLGKGGTIDGMKFIGTVVIVENVSPAQFWHGYITDGKIYSH